MTTQVTKTVLVNVPVSRAYNQWTQFEEFPQFMSGVRSVTQLADDRLDWVAEIAGVRRQWQARILEQVPDRKVAWAATEGATNAGSVTFEDLGGGQTSVSLFLEYEPEGVVEKAGDAVHLIERQAQADLDRFKEFIESEQYATGAWRGSVAQRRSCGYAGRRGCGRLPRRRRQGRRVRQGRRGWGRRRSGRRGRRGGGNQASFRRQRRRRPGGRRSTPGRESGTVDARGARMLTDEEIEAGASDVPLDASNTDRERQ